MQYIIPMTRTQHSWIKIEADTPEEALKKVNQGEGEFEDDPIRNDDDGEWEISKDDTMYDQDDDEYLITKELKAIPKIKRR